MEERGWPVLVVVVAAVLLVLPSDGGRGGGAGTDPVTGFLAAYERSLTATYVVEQRFTRTAPDGRAISYDQRLVQRPPEDRLLVGGGNGEGRIDGRVVWCFTSVDGSSRCDQSVPAEPYAAFVATEVERVRRLVVGSNPVYEVRAGEPGCWSLHLRLDVHPPPFGTLAGFCFDAASGAVLRQEERRPEATDVVEATSIRTEVTPADLRPGDLGDLPVPESGVEISE